MSSYNSKHDPARDLISRAVVIENNSVLVNQSRNSKTGEEYCALPGGHVDAGESCVAALAREFEEELRAEIEIHDLCFVSESIYAGRKKDETRRHELVLYFRAELSAPLPAKNGQILSPEKNKNFRWLPLTELPDANLLPASIKEFLLNTRAATTEPRYAFSDTTRE